MKFYNSFESTPLNFHKAFYKIISPILIVVQAIYLLATIGHLINYDGYYGFVSLILNLLFSSLAIVFLSFTTYGFAKRKEYAWYMVYAYLILTVLSSIISAIQAASGAFAVGQIVGALIIPTLIGIYYYKRKPLFVTSKVENATDTTERTPQYIGNSYSENNGAIVHYCRECGNRVKKDSVFCNRCGTKINWN